MWRFFLCFVLTFTAMPAFAQSVGSGTSCDAGFHDVLRNKAWMEAQREVEVAQTLMLKAESVLDYTCFKNWANQVQGSSLFTRGGDVDAVLAGAQLGCLSMAQVWSALRCDNVRQDQMFPSFSDLVANDIRGCGNAARDVRWGTAYDLSYPLEAGSDYFGAGNMPEAVEAFFAKANPKDCGQSAFVKTGLTSSNDVEEVTCVAPGCVFDGGRCVAQ